MNDRLDTPPLIDGHCTASAACPLSSVQAGTTVCIKELLASPELCHRLREMGLGEEQRIKLLLRQSSFICQVCNARLGISSKLAESILVEAVSAEPTAA